MYNINLNYKESKRNHNLYNTCNIYVRTIYKNSSNNAPQQQQAITINLKIIAR